VRDQVKLSARGAAIRAVCGPERSEAATYQRTTEDKPTPMEAELSGRTVLVTGGAGFVGSHLVDALVEENDVRVLDDFSTGSRSNLPDEATMIEGDVRDADARRRATDGVDLIFHEAAVVSVERSVEAPGRSNEVNLDATLGLLERAREQDARFVLASSSAIYGPPTAVPIAEDEPKEPMSPYATQKLAADHYARQYHDLYGLETVALRYFNIYGPRQRAGDYSGVISAFLGQAREGEPITVEGDGEQTRDFVHVSDVVRANLLAATTDAVGEAFNVGTGTSVTIAELAREIRSLVDSDSDVVHVDPRPGDVEHSCADISRSKRRLGYEPTVSLRAGLETLTR
jgi:UDP-glucose 4-epimerase